LCKTKKEYEQNKKTSAQKEKNELCQSSWLNFDQKLINAKFSKLSTYRQLSAATTGGNDVAAAPRSTPVENKL